MGTKTIVLAIGGILLAAVSLLFRPLGFLRHAPNTPTALARKENLAVVVSGSGILVPQRSIILSCEILSNRGKIIWLVPEGKGVGEGDDLLKFDPLPFQTDIERLQGEVAQTDTLLTQAEHDLELEESKGEDDLSSAHQRVLAAENALKNVIEGEGPLRVKEAELKVNDSRVKLAESQKRLADVEALMAEGFGRQDELRQAKAALDKAQTDLDFSLLSLETLKKTILPADQQKSEFELESAKKALVRTREAIVLRVARQRAIIEQNKLHLQSLNRQLTEAKDQLAKCVLKAPSQGVVVYLDYTMAGEKRKPQVGDTVWFGQPLLMLPDVSAMAVNLDLREFDIHKISVGQSAKIELEVVPGMVFSGQVSQVATLPRKDPESGRTVFATKVVLSDSDPVLRPGVSARVTIEAGHYDRNVVVPVEAVFESGGKTVCYVQDGKEFRERPVELGPNNERMVVVWGGIRTGERVALLPPQE